MLTRCLPCLAEVFLLEGTRPPGEGPADHHFFSQQLPLGCRPKMQCVGRNYFSSDGRKDKDFGRIRCMCGLVCLLQSARFETPRRDDPRCPCCTSMAAVSWGLNLEKCVQSPCSDMINRPQLLEIEPSASETEIGT